MKHKGGITIHNIELAKTGCGLSGGEVCLVEVAKYLGKYYKNIVYVPENGKDVYENNGLVARYEIVGSYAFEKRFGVVLAYLWRILLATFKVPRFEQGTNNVIISHSDFLPSVWYALLMKLRNPSAKWIAFCHMVAPSPFRGYEGEFTGKRRIVPEPRLILYNASQRLFFLLAGIKADKAVFTNRHYEELLSKSSLKTKSEVITYGTVLDMYMCEGDAIARNYDGVFVGRFHSQKGIFELVDICKRIGSSRPDFRLAIIGSGSKRFEDKLRRKIRSENLTNNIDLAGYKEGDEKCQFLLRSRVFMFPSCYESFGIVAIEAMSCGLPVVAYDLPVFNGIFDKGMVRVPVLDNEAFSKAVLRLLCDQGYYDSLSREALEHSGKFTWERTGKQLESVILGLLRD